MNTFAETIQFIQAFRRMERGSDKYANLIIKQLSDQKRHEQLSTAWKYKRKDFADWYLNIDMVEQSEVIRIFGLGINDGSIDIFISLRQNNSLVVQEISIPTIVKRYYKLMTFFLNYSIEDHPAKNIMLPVMAQYGKRYGNSENWGDYILSLNTTQQQYLIEQIIRHTNNE